MVFTFDPLLTAARDRLRFALGDADADAPLLEDATYDALLATMTEAAAGQLLAAGLWARFAARPDRVTTPSGLSVSWGARAARLKALSEDWSLAAGGAATAATTGSYAPVRADAPIAGDEFGSAGWPP